MNKNLLISVMRLFGETNTMLAEAMGIAVPTFSNKINEMREEVINKIDCIIGAH